MFLLRNANTTTTTTTKKSQYNNVEQELFNVRKMTAGFLQTDTTTTVQQNGRQQSVNHNNKLLR